ncbi:efflux RND transporter periplasmic adaptor subunit [Sebaldella sp. S0638]|uniref:efflux RND transporter periplasmic adaptor subunit n=1 Tax=Sebaldella sp. S0638 TaxID=2957809 RepID=UPI00209E5AC0|nr:efflux RND transporter periplasmic adaptor subunit [Sebaldella sp. S0638]MCP1222808.1 efflux RND transporter periplasmic adaptor subunit [Sebaldella sp. S0638]
MKKKIIIAVLLIVVLLLGFLFFKSSSKKDKNEVAYEVVTAEKGNLQLFVEETGQVKSNNEISVYTSKKLMVAKRYFELGDTVKKGDIILTFDPTDKNSALRSIQEKKISLEQKQRDRVNTGELLKVGGAPRVDLQDIDYDIRTLRLEIANLEEDYQKYDDRIISPVDGVITEMIADDNYRVNTDSPLFKITNIRDLSIKVDLTDYDAKNVKVGQKALITADALTEGETITGRVVDIASTATKDTSYNESRVEIEIRLDNPGLLKPGNVVDAKVLYLDEQNVIKLPYTSVLNENNKYFVYIVDKDNKVMRKEVTVGETDNNFYHIKSGINVGDRVVKEADLNLKDGEKIKIADTKAGAGNGKKGNKKGNQRTPGAPRGPM